MSYTKTITFAKDNVYYDDDLRYVPETTLYTNFMYITKQNNALRAVCVTSFVLNISIINTAN